MERDLYQNTDYFELTQPNPTEKKKAKKDDCTMRAISIVLNITWQEAFDILVNEARKQYDMPNSMKVLEKVLKNNGFETITMKIEKGRKRLTAEQFAKSTRKGTYILRVAKHVCAVVDGKIKDAWNCGDSCIYKIYQKQ